MDNYTITYVSFIFTNDNGKEIEKIKTQLIPANNEDDAENKFKKSNTKHKKIISIEKDMTNSLGNICPNLSNLRNKFI